MRLASLLACAGLVFSTFAFGQSGFTKKVTPFTSYPTNAMLPFDFNRDGHTDLLMPGSPQITIALNDGSGTFTKQLVTITPDDAAGNATLGPVAIADFNGDGYPDVAACSSRNDGNFLEIFTNEGGASLALRQTIKLAQQCVGLTAIDFNGDGKWDLVLGEANNATGSDSGLRVFLGNGAGTFSFSIGQPVTLSDPQQPTSACTLSSLAGADYQATGRYDLVLIGNCVPTTSPFTYGIAYYAVKSSAGTYGLEFISDLPGSGAAQVLAVNHDLKPDLLLILSNSGVDGSFSSSATVLRSLGGEQFAVETAEGANMSDGCGTILFTAAGGDLTGNGYADFAGNFTNNGNCDMNEYYVQLVKGNSSNTFTSWQQWNEPQAAAMAIADVTNDNRNDILVDISGVEVDAFVNTQSFSPSTSCKPKGAGPTLCTPLAGSDYASTVNFQSTGVGVTGPVRLMELWIDGKKVGNYPGNFFNKSFNLASGTHTATVVQLEFNGQSFRSPRIAFKVN